MLDSQTCLPPADFFMFSGPLLQVLKKRRACPEANFTIHEKNIFFRGEWRNLNLFGTLKQLYNIFDGIVWGAKTLEFCQRTITTQKNLKLTAKVTLKSYKCFDADLKVNAS